MFLKSFLSTDNTPINKICYNQSNNQKLLINSEKVLHTSLCLDKKLFQDIIKKQEKSFLSLEIYLHPKVFFNLTKMLLISNDCQIIKSFKQTRSMADTDLTTQY
jgi:hypothetical protein